MLGVFSGPKELTAAQIRELRQSSGGCWPCGKGSTWYIKNTIHMLPADSIFRMNQALVNRGRPIIPSFSGERFNTVQVQEWFYQCILSLDPSNDSGLMCEHHGPLKSSPFFGMFSEVLRKATDKLAFPVNLEMLHDRDNKYIVNARIAYFQLRECCFNVATAQQGTAELRQNMVRLVERVRYWIVKGFGSDYYKYSNWMASINRPPCSFNRFLACYASDVFMSRCMMPSDFLMIPMLMAMVSRSVEIARRPALLQHYENWGARLIDSNVISHQQFAAFNGTVFLHLEMRHGHLYR